MKHSILLLTDLSQNTKSAEETALILAGRLDKNLFLLNCNTTISAITYYPVMPVMSESPTWYEDRKGSLKLITDHLSHQFQQAFPGKNKPGMKSIIKEGDLLENVKDVLKLHKIDLIVMGAQSGSSTDHFLFGRDTKQIVDHVAVPILIVPNKSQFKSTIKITFATDFLDQDTTTLNYLFEFRQQLDAILDIVHIKKFGEPNEIKNLLVKDMIDKACLAKPGIITYQEVYGKEIIPRLEHFCRENEADIMVLSHQHHSFLFRNFKEGIVDKALFAQAIPLLIIPELPTNINRNESSFKDLKDIVF